MVANLIVEHLAIKQKSNDFYLKCGIISLTNLNFGTEIGIISQTQRQNSLKMMRLQRIFLLLIALILKRHYHIYCEKI